MFVNVCNQLVLMGVENTFTFFLKIVLHKISLQSAEQWKMKRNQLWMHKTNPLEAIKRIFDESIPNAKQCTTILHP